MDLIVGTKYVIDELNHRDKKENSNILITILLSFSKRSGNWNLYKNRGFIIVIGVNFIWENQKKD